MKISRLLVLESGSTPFISYVTIIFHVKANYLFPIRSFAFTKGFCVSAMFSDGEGGDKIFYHVRSNSFYFILTLLGYCLWRHKNVNNTILTWKRNSLALRHQWDLCLFNVHFRDLILMPTTASKIVKTWKINRVLFGTVPSGVIGVSVDRQKGRAEFEYWLNPFLFACIFFKQSSLSKTGSHYHARGYRELERVSVLKAKEIFVAD